jgi:2-polyprenyl-3-methyl-5-hydroxy-6-metoxy-1,4-benzoquinol methylase
VRRLLADLAAQLRPPPGEERAAREQARRYADREALAHAARVAGEGLDDQEERLFAGLPAGARVLDVGCGGGRVSHALAARGMDVQGIDVCPEVIDVARRAGSPARFRVAALHELDDVARWDVIFLSSDVYAATPGRARRVDALRRCRRATAPGGRVIVAAHVAREWSPLGRVVLDGARRLGVLGGEPGDRVARGCFRHRFFSAEEIRAEAAEAGLDAAPRDGHWVALVGGARRFRRRDDVAVERGQGEILLVQLGGGEVFRLDDAGREVFELAGQGLSDDEIATRLGAPRAEITAFLDELEAERLLERA